MPDVKRFVSVALLIPGVGLVFLGLTRSLGFTLVSVLASVAAIAALLYTGSVWFGSAASPRHPPAGAGAAAPMLFDLHGRLITGPSAGQPVASQFPESARLEIDRQCAAALYGRAGRFPCTRDGESLVFEVLPIRAADGAIILGIIVPLGGGAALAAV
jgi:hypothetical protein